MRAMFMALALAALPLSACATTPLAPVDVAQASLLDERLAITAHLAYKAARTAVELGVNAGQIKGTQAACVAAADSRAYRALQAVDTAYTAANSASYAAAVAEAQAAIGAVLQSINSEGGCTATKN